MIRTIQILYVVISLLTANTIFCSQVAGRQERVAALQKIRQSLSEKAKYECDPALLLIFLDDTESNKANWGAVTKNLVSALLYSAGPMIVSSSLLYSIFNKNALPKETIQWKNTLKFDAEKWVIKEINSYLYLLIPDWYCIKKQTTLEDARKYGEANPKETETELTLGLRVNHMKNKTDLEFKHYNVFPVHYFMPEIKNKTIFCERAAYYKRSKIPYWAVYMNAHGTVGNKPTIAALSNESSQVGDFQSFLDYLQQRINTRLLVLASCYAAGENLKNAMTDVKSNISKNYQYAIITDALTDTQTYTMTRFSIRQNKLEEGIQRVKSISLKLIENQDCSINYEAIGKVSTIQGLVRPQIKLPGIDWFHVYNADQKVVSIGSILARVRGADRPLNVVKFFRTDPEIILLYTNIIPFELIINTKNLKSIVSMQPPRSNITTIAKISSEIASIDTILNWFMESFASPYQRYFYIKNINDTNEDVLFFLGQANKSYAIYKKINEASYYKKEFGKPSYPLSGPPPATYKIYVENYRNK